MLRSSASTSSTSEEKPDSSEYTGSRSDRHGSNASSQAVPRRPWYSYALLALALVAVSSGGTLLKLVRVSPVLKAAHRMLVTSVALAPLMAGQVYWLSGGPVPCTLDRQPLDKRYATLRTWVQLCASALALAVHFGTWIYSLDHTSLAHSLLFVSTTPLVIVVASWAMFIARVRKTRVSLGETLGAVVGFAGLGLSLVDARDSSGDERITWRGNLAAFAGGVAMAVCT